MEHDNQMKGKLAVTFSLAALLGTTFLLFQHFTEEGGQAESINALTIAVEELRGRNSQLASELDSLQVTTQELQLDYLYKKFRHNIDFATPDVQEINKGFMIARASQEEHLTGIKFEGRIINSQSVAHESLTFLLTVNDTSKEFNISRISPGNSTSFSVYMPNLNAENARYAKVEYMSSSVRFYTR